MTGTPTHEAWLNIKRLISCPERWRDSFDDFWQDMGDSPGKGYTVVKKNRREPHSRTNSEWVLKGKKAGYVAKKEPVESDPEIRISVFIPDEAKESAIKQIRENGFLTIYGTLG